jgi:peptidoglycan/xylan/chitin deacetylase (PgdA/CDA1 family)
MSGWLDPLRAVLDEAPSPVTFFFRDDDAGWRDDRLRRLLALFDRFEAPLDLAVIPCALGPGLARDLRARRDADPRATGLHQHGFAHANHEPTGRKCEFGAARNAEAQRADIERGQRLLEKLLDTRVDPIFTPPWNRCTRETGHVLVESGLPVLSRESRAPPLGVRGLRELPVHVDWFGHRKGVRLSREQLGGALAAEAGGGCPVGVMLHHAVMDAGERRMLAELLALLTSSADARLVPMAALAA